MEVSINKEETLSSVRSILALSGNEVNLDSIVFAGEKPAENTITTLPSTFPEGDYRYETYHKVLAMKNQGYKVKQIAEMISIPVHLVKGYYHRNNPRAFSSVESADKEGILPFSYQNSRIQLLNALFALCFWTGCILKGLIEVVPNNENISALEQNIEKLGYSRKSAERTKYKKETMKYSVRDKEIYLVHSAALSRVFALLGLPYEEGNKARIKGFEIPWYANLMFGRYFTPEQQFGTKSTEMAEKFQRIFLYALLSDKAQSVNYKDGIAISLMGSDSQEVGEKLTSDIAKMLMQAFHGLDIPERHLITTSRVSFGGGVIYRNLVHIYSSDLHALLEHLYEDSNQNPNGVMPVHIHVRQLAANALERLVQSGFR